MNKKIKSREEFRVKFNTIYKYLIKNNPKLLNEVLPRSAKINTKEDCLKDALKYKTVSEWAKAPNTKYSSARTHGWIEYCCSHMNKRFVWTLDLCKKDAEKCSSKAEWKSRFPNSYSAAKKKGFVKKCSKHMTRPVSEKKKKIIRSDGKIYMSVTDCKKDGFLGISAALSKGIRSGGFHWRYYE